MRQIELLATSRDFQSSLRRKNLPLRQYARDPPRELLHIPRWMILVVEVEVVVVADSGWIPQQRAI